MSHTDARYRFEEISPSGLGSIWDFTLFLSTNKYVFQGLAKSYKSMGFYLLCQMITKNVNILRNRLNNIRT